MENSNPEQINEQSIQPNKGNNALTWATIIMLASAVIIPIFYFSFIDDDCTVDYFWLVNILRSIKLKKGAIK